MEEGAAAHNTNCFPHATLINPSIHIRETAPLTAALLLCFSSSSSPRLSAADRLCARPLLLWPRLCLTTLLGEFRHFGEMYCSDRAQNPAPLSNPSSMCSMYAVWNVLERSLVIEGGVVAALFTLSTVNCVIDWPINCNWGHAAWRRTGRPRCRK